MSQICFAQTQRPVGQGGFHTGCLFHRSYPTLKKPPSFSWVYDCGSDQASVLATQINNVSGAGFNVLFLSHLDGDHVSGVDMLLLAASGVDEVVLSYLDDTDWTLHLAAAVAAGRLTGSFIDLVTDPAGWFGARGVGRITYVEAGDEDAAESGPDPIEPREPESDRQTTAVDRAQDPVQPIEIGWSRPPRTIHPGDKSGARAEAVSVPRGAVATVVESNLTLNWVLSPFAFRPPAAKMRAFQEALDEKFGVGLSAGDYAAFARTAAGRAKLRKCFEVVWKSHNLHSLALYAGPAIQTSGKLRNTAWHGRFVRRMTQPGWVSTGDFDTSVKKRRDALTRYYAPYSAMVGQLGLPHHGSDLSFDAAILDAFPDLSCAIAAVGVNGHGHPGVGVQAAVASKCSIDFVRVDEDPSSLYEVRGPITRTGPG